MPYPSPVRQHVIVRTALLAATCFALTFLPRPAAQAQGATLTTGGSLMAGSMATTGSLSLYYPTTTGGTLSTSGTTTLNGLTTTGGSLSLGGTTATSLFTLNSLTVNNTTLGTNVLAFVMTGNGFYTLANSYLHPAFFVGERYLNNGVFYMNMPNGSPFGYYAYLGTYALPTNGSSGGGYIYHFDMGYEYVSEALDIHYGIYLYDFASQTWFYTSPSFPFPYLYDFSLNTVLYYFPDPNNPGHYNTNGVRYFYRFDTGQIITK